MSKLIILLLLILSIDCKAQTVFKDRYKIYNKAIDSVLNYFKMNGNNLHPPVILTRHNFIIFDTVLCNEDDGYFNEICYCKTNEIKDSSYKAYFLLRPEIRQYKYKDPVHYLKFEEKFPNLLQISLYLHCVRIINYWHLHPPRDWTPFYGVMYLIRFTFDESNNITCSEFNKFYGR